jgi:hypothetical protein
MNPLEYFYDLEKMHNFLNLKGALEELINILKLYLLTLTLFFDWLDSLIGPNGLLLIVSHLFAILLSVLWMGLEKNN